jgi:hypothetical protein
VTSAIRRYQARSWTLMAVYVVAVFTVALLIKHVIPPGPWRYAAALLPAVPLVGVIVSVGLYVREEADEFRRAVYVQSMLWGLGLVLVLSTVWGFLELLADAPHVEGWWVFPIYCVAQAVARHGIARWYR